jgi:anhydro-N-acetylmuramic acid kinase
LLDGKEGVVVNLGGIANTTIVKNNQVIGFDTGPANTLLDNWIKRHKNLEHRVQFASNKYPLDEK